MIKLIYSTWLESIIGIKKKIVINRKDKKHNLSIYYKQNFTSNLDNSSGDCKNRAFNYWDDKIFSEIKKK